MESRLTSTLSDVKLRKDVVINRTTESILDGTLEVAGGSSTSASVGNLVNGTAYTFRVAARNQIGVGPNSASSADAVPIGPAEAPTAVVGTAADGAVALRWTAPAVTGGSPITGWQVVPSVGGSALPVRTVQGATPETLVTGLTNGAAHTFKVTAVTSFGPGAASAASAPVTPAPQPPGVPSGVAAVAGNHSAKVTWAAPTSTGSGEISGYEVSWYVGSTLQDVLWVEASVTSVVVPDLTNGTGYTFRVAAINEHGNGPMSPATATVTPVDTSLPLCGSLGGRTLLSGKVYVVTCDSTVAAGSTLTVQGGAVVKSAGRTIDVAGTLNVTGVAFKPAIFTSVADDAAGGDTNGDGDRTAPASGEGTIVSLTGTMTVAEAEIRFGWIEAVDATSLSLDHLVMTDPGSQSWDVAGPVTLNAVRVRGVTWDDRHHPSLGIDAAGAIAVTGSTIATSTGIDLAGDSSITLTGNDLRSTEWTGSTVYINARAGSGSISITGNKFVAATDGADFGLSMYIDADGGTGLRTPTVTGNTIANATYGIDIVNQQGGLDPSKLTGNTGQGLSVGYVAMSGVLATDWSVPSVPNGLPIAVGSSGVTVPAGRTLALGQGAVLGTFPAYGSELLIRGSLTSAGTASSPAIIRPLGTEAIEFMPVRVDQSAVALDLHDLKVERAGLSIIGTGAAKLRRVSVGGKASHGTQSLFVSRTGDIDVADVTVADASCESCASFIQGGTGLTSVTNLTVARGSSSVAAVEIDAPGTGAPAPVLANVKVQDHQGIAFKVRAQNLAPNLWTGLSAPGTIRPLLVVGGRLISDLTRSAPGGRWHPGLDRDQHRPAGRRRGHPSVERRSPAQGC